MIEIKERSRVQDKTETSPKEKHPVSQAKAQNPSHRYQLSGLDLAINMDEFDETGRIGDPAANLSAKPSPKEKVRTHEARSDERQSMDETLLAAETV